MLNLKLKRALVLFILILALGFPCFAQETSSNLARDIEALKQGQEAIRKELQEIKNLLRIQKTPVNMPTSVSVRDVEFELTNDLIEGDESAKLILVNITDYQCPFCARFTRETYPQIVKEYVNTGKIRYAVLDNPLASHTLAPKAAEAARCARDQGKYWELHKQMMSDQKSLGELSSYAASSGLDIKTFQNCLDTNKYADAVKKDMALTSKFGIAIVPGFIIASVDPKNPFKLKGISSILGAQPFASFQKSLEQALEEIGKR